MKSDGRLTRPRLACQTTSQRWALQDFKVSGWWAARACIRKGADPAAVPCGAGESSLMRHGDGRARPLESLGARGPANKYPKRSEDASPPKAAFGGQPWPLASVCGQAFGGGTNMITARAARISVGRRVSPLPSNRPAHKRHGRLQSARNGQHALDSNAGQDYMSRAKLGHQCHAYVASLDLQQGRWGRVQPTMFFLPCAGTLELARSRVRLEPGC